MKIDILVNIDNLWGQSQFVKKELGLITYLVGPNGTGKSQFIQKLIPQLEQGGLKCRYLSSDRLVSWTRSQNLHYANSNLNAGINISELEEFKKYSRIRGDVIDAFALLRENLKIKIKIEATLSKLLNRSIVLAEEEGRLVPKVSKTGNTYSFKEDESHGLKMIITMLTFLYDDSYNCLIVDEPELHLHPQFQTLLLQEARKIAGNPMENDEKKCFIFATHSPNIVDLRTTDDLKNCIVFQPDTIPRYIDELESNDNFKLNLLIPRLNIHHKQLLFSQRPIFVEGFTDQQLFSLIQELRGRLIGYGNSSFIDVNGKDEIDLFFRLSKQLGIDSRIIVDLDCLIEGNLRSTVSKDERCAKYLQEKGVDIEFVKSWSKVSLKIDDCIADFLKLNEATLGSEQKKLYDAVRATEKKEKKRYLFILAIRHMKNELLKILTTHKDDIAYLEGGINVSIEAFRASNVFVLSNGELENYLFPDNHYSIPDKKSEYFMNERKYLLDQALTESDIKNRYSELIDILDKTVEQIRIDYKTIIERYVIVFVQSVQLALKYSNINSVGDIKKDPTVNFSKYEQIIEIVSFNKINQGRFQCSVKIIGFENINPLINFDEKSTPVDIQID